jgi:CRISPR/Cas system-associated protein Cas7 (RAMP superfamily)
MTTKRIYDGFHLLPSFDRPGGEVDGVELHFFTIDNKDGHNRSKEVLYKNDVGEMYNVMLMIETEEGIVIDDMFSAIFADPVVYAENLFGTNIYGTFVKRSEIGENWWEHYISTMTESIEDINGERKIINGDLN